MILFRGIYWVLFESGICMFSSTNGFWVKSSDRRRRWTGPHTVCTRAEFETFISTTCSSAHGIHQVSTCWNTVVDARAWPPTASLPAVAAKQTRLSKRIRGCRDKRKGVRTWRGFILGQSRSMNVCASGHAHTQTRACAAQGWVISSGFVLAGSWASVETWVRLMCVSV